MPVVGCGHGCANLRLADKVFDAIGQVAMLMSFKDELKFWHSLSLTYNVKSEWDHVPFSEVFNNLQDRLTHAVHSLPAEETTAKQRSIKAFERAQKLLESQVLQRSLSFKPEDRPSAEDLMNVLNSDAISADIALIGDIRANPETKFISHHDDASQPKSIVMPYNAYIGIGGPR